MLETSFSSFITKKQTKKEKQRQNNNKNKTKQIKKHDI